MLATPATGPTELPRGSEWSFEVKWDGVRALADTTSGALRLWSRQEREITLAYPELAEITQPPDGTAIRVLFQNLQRKETGRILEDVFLMRPKLFQKPLPQPRHLTRAVIKIAKLLSEPLAHRLHFRLECLKRPPTSRSDKVNHLHRRRAISQPFQCHVVIPNGTGSVRNTA